MTNDHVSAWLEDLGLGIYRETFEQNAIDWDVLPHLNEGDLEALGILLGHRKKLLRAIASLSQSAEAMGRGSVPVSVVPGRQPSHLESDQAERRQLTVMFCDLVDSTALSRHLDPEALQDIVRRFLDTCSQAIARYEGYIARYMGDGMMVYFGYPHAHEDDAERAVHSGLAILDAVKLVNRKKTKQGFKIAARIGIATGQVVVGELIGQEIAKERPVFGETPNRAARLQGLAKPNQLIVDPTTKRLVGSQFAFRDLGNVSLKGFEKPVQTWQVLSVELPASRFEAHRAARLVNFIGREDEVSLLYGRWREVVGGEGQVLLLTGEAGIGKSRIIQILCERIGEERHHIIRYQCSPHHTSTALYPAINYLRQAAGFASNDSSNAKLNKLNFMAVEAGVEDQKTVSWIADLLSIRRDHPNPTSNVSPEIRKEMIFEALVQHLRSLATRCSGLFIVEDAHWIDPTTHDLMTRIIDHVQHMRMLLVITFRPNFKPVWSDHSHVTSLTLSRLPRRHCTQLVSAITGGKSLPPEVQQAILAKTDGVPLYVEELTKNVLESGALTEEAHAYTLKATLKELSIPESLQASLMERVDRFAPIREIVQAGAAIGREFSYDLLQASVRASSSQLRNALDLLVASGLLFQEGDPPVAKYHFKHTLVQEAAYSTLLSKARQLLHARIGKALESRFADRAKMEPELLAYHYEQARCPAPAIDYWYLAARRAAEHSANTEALNHFNSALHLLRELPEGLKRDTLELELLLARGAPLLAIKGYASDEMEQNYSRARLLSQTVGSPLHKFRAIWGLWVFHLVRGPLADALALAENLLALANRQESPDLLVEAHRNGGTTYFWLGRFGEARTHLLTAMTLYDRTQHRSHTLLYGQDPGVTSRVYLVRTLWVLGEVEQAEKLAVEAIAMARGLDHPFTLAFALAALSWVYSSFGYGGRTLELANEAIAISTQYSFELVLAWAKVSQGWALVANGQEQGADSLISGLSAARAAGAGLNNTASLALLAEIYLRKSRFSEGLATIEDALKVTLTHGELFWKAELFRVKGELLFGQSDQLVSAAEQCLGEALGIARNQQAKMLELRAATSLARIWQKLRRFDDAKRVLKSVYSGFKEAPETPDLIEAKKVLEQLNGAMN
jgi:class 3 adenylate cyclase/predicted ATPase